MKKFTIVFGIVLLGSLHVFAAEKSNKDLQPKVENFRKVQYFLGLMLNSLWSKTQHNRFHVVIKPGEVFPSEIVDFDFMAKKISQIDAFLDNPGVKSQCRFDDSQDGFYFTSIKQTMCLVCVLEKNTKMHINAPFIKQISQETFDNKSLSKVVRSVLK